MRLAWVLAGVLGLGLGVRVEAASTSRTISVACAAGARRSGESSGVRWGGIRRGTIRQPGEVPPLPREPDSRIALPPPCLHEFAFGMEVLPDTPQVGLRAGPNNAPLMLVRSGTTYSIRLTNPLPVRAAVSVTVDGINTISGEPGGPADGAKWMVGPYGSTTISGWQTGSRSARRFVFTAKGSSYAQYRSHQVGQDLAANCGVIGAAFFWSSAELEAALYHRPQNWEAEGGIRRSSHAAKMAPASAASESGRGFDAGTGQGEHVYNPVHSVQFVYDAGMYDPGGALAIYYDFPGPGDLYPRPFSGGGNFAPEMPPAYRR